MDVNTKQIIKMIGNTKIPIGWMIKVKHIIRVMKLINLNKWSKNYHWKSKIK